MAMRQDATVTFVEPRSPRAMSAVAHLPGVMDVEPMRSVPVRLRAGHRSRTLAITGLPETPRLNRIVNRERSRAVAARRRPRAVDDARRHSRRLARRPAAGRGARGEAVRAAGPGRRRSSTTASGCRPTCGSTRFARCSAKAASITGAAVTLDPAAIGRFYAAVKALPAVAGVALRDVTLQNFRETMAREHEPADLLQRDVRRRSSRSAWSTTRRASRSRSGSASWRACACWDSRAAEISLILLGELAVLTLLALPVGAVIGYGLGELIMTGFNNEMYRLSFVTSAGDHRLVVSDRHRGGRRVRPARPAAARPPRSGGGPQDAGMMRDAAPARQPSRARFSPPSIARAWSPSALWPRPTVRSTSATVARGPLVVTVDEEGVTRVRDRFVVSAPVAGRVLRIELEPGDRVTRGQVVARVRAEAPPLLDARTRAEAEAAVESAQGGARPGARGRAARAGDAGAGQREI